MVEDLKLQEDLGYPVVTPDHRLGLCSPQHKGVLLEELHRLLQPMEELPGPQDLPSYGRLVPSQGRIIFLSCIQLRNHVDVRTKILKNYLVFFLDTKVRYIQSNGKTKSTKFWINKKYIYIYTLILFINIHFKTRQLKAMELLNSVFKEQK